MEEFEQEPNMSFAKALVVVVMLHVVAVGGIYAFNTIKARKIAQGDSIVAHSTKDAAVTGAAVSSAANRTVANVPKTSSVAASHESQAQGASEVVRTSNKTGNETAKSPETPHTRKIEEPAKPVAKETASARESGSVYTVAKGDNPVTIARKFHVSYDELLKINKITDPKKLKIGQKLKIPAKTSATKKKEG